MKPERCLPIVLGILMMSADRPLPAQTRPVDCTAISERDAKLLVYLLPVAFELRAKNRDVAMEREPGVEKDTPGKYVLRVDAIPQNRSGSSLVGYFKIDKCTGEVTDSVADQAVSSGTLRGVQRIMMQTKDR